MTVPTNGLNLALHNLRLALGGSTAFQTFLGAIDAAAADLRIHTDAIPKPASGQAYSLAEITSIRPCATIWSSDDQGGYRAYEDAVGTFAATGQLTCEFLWSIPDGIINDPKEIHTQFTNHIGDIFDDLIAQSETGLQIKELETEGPYRAPDDMIETYGQYMQGFIHLSWKGIA